MEKAWFDTELATVKAKVINVLDGVYPTLHCLVKEFFYNRRRCKKTEKVVFDDYSCEMTFCVKDAPIWDRNYNDCDAEKKVKTIVKGDIVEFGIRKDGNKYFFTSFKIVETEQK